MAASGVKISGWFTALLASIGVSVVNWVLFWPAGGMHRAHDPAHGAAERPAARAGLKRDRQRREKKCEDARARLAS